MLNTMHLPAEWSTMKKLLWLRGMPANQWGSETLTLTAFASPTTKTVTKKSHVTSCAVSYEPQQDLHGYDSPWPSGGGVNKFDESTVEYGKWISSSGSVSTFAQYGCISVKIPVAGASACGIKCSSAPYSMSIVEYDSTDAFVTRNHIASNTELSATLGANTSYVIVQFSCGNGSSTVMTAEILAGYEAMFYLGSTAPASYSPYSNISPITGWTGAEVNITGSNIWGGEKMADDMVAAVNSATNSAKGSDTDGSYVFLRGSSSVGNAIFFNIPFKTNTQYTLILKAKKSNANRSSNIIVRYTDGTSERVYVNNALSDSEIVPDTLYTWAHVTAENKTVSIIKGLYLTGTCYLYYNNCGLFEGVITTADYVAYNGATTSVQFGDTSYGGIADVVGGSGSETKQMFTINAQSTYYMTVTATNRLQVQIDELKPNTTAMCNMFRYAQASSAAGTWYISTYQSRVFFNSPTENTFTTLEEWQTWLASNTIEFVGELSTTTPFTFTGAPLDLQEGDNECWAEMTNT